MLLIKFYILVSEILGGIRNNENAKDSYLEAFELVQDNLRILAKLYECCVLLNEYEDQIKHSKLLLKLEKRGSISAKYAHALSSLLRGKNLDEATEVAYKYWELNSGSVNLAYLLSELLIEKSDYNFAINILNSTINSIKDSRLSVHVEALESKITEHG